MLHLAPGFANAAANLHNARKAGSGILNIMGDHATYHQRHESPLKGDTEATARAVSHWTRASRAATQVATDGAAAIEAARSRNGQIATLILPADTAWDPATEAVTAPPPPPLRQPTSAEIAAAAAALRLPGAALLIDGPALHSDAALIAARIAAAAGCRLIAPNLPARITRGAGAVAYERLAYVVEENVAVLAGVTQLILIGTPRPASFFAYPGKPSLPEPPGCAVHDLCQPDMDSVATLAALAAALNAPDTPPPEAFWPLDPPPVPSGAMSLPKIGQALAALLPEGAVVVDEAITTARHLAGPSQTARRHDWLHVTGGAIGYGLPNAVGAAVACPDRKIIAAVGDGSAMYTVQSLWTMAREGLDVCVVIFANRGYQTLRGEMVNVGITQMGRNAVRMFDVMEPTLDWVALARGHGVEAVRVTDTDQFVAAFAGAMDRAGPFLIEVVCA